MISIDWAHDAGSQGSRWPLSPHTELASTAQINHVHNNTMLASAARLACQATQCRHGHGCTRCNAAKANLRISF
eukprot:364411-Chlamydomonas_euryale.AAC.3